MRTKFNRIYKDVHARRLFLRVDTKNMIDVTCKSVFGDWQVKILESFKSPYGWLNTEKLYLIFCIVWNCLCLLFSVTTRNYIYIYRERERERERERNSEREP
jgi:hypothetical protein